MKRLYALRGATQCDNTVNDICEKVAIMYDELLSANKLDEDEIVSVIFSVTDDLTAVNPCAALRKGGRAGELALFSAQEPESQVSLERTIRVLVHCYLDEGSKPRHVYRNGAEVLRPDRCL
ncbi:MAG: chorismate mutase [Spirochaetes bacterium]|nr:chorismate mutase [Brevinematales bacterium]MCL1959778.1 chorismate mutase [Spirochaetota bacterium]